MGFKPAQLGKWSVNSMVNLKSGTNKRHFIGAQSKKYYIHDSDSDEYIEFSSR